MQHRFAVTTWLQVLVVVVLGCLLTFASERYDQQLGEQAEMNRIEAQLRSAALRLERNLGTILQVNYDFAAALPPDLSVNQPALDAVARRLLAAHPRLINVTLSHKLDVVFVFPVKGNEAVMGMTYANRPYIMTSLQRGIEARETIVAGPINLVQSGRPGLVARTPLFPARADGQPGEFAGVVSTAIDSRVCWPMPGWLARPCPLSWPCAGATVPGRRARFSMAIPACSNSRMLPSI